MYDPLHMRFSPLQRHILWVLVIGTGLLLISETHHLTRTEANYSNAPPLGFGSGVSPSPGSTEFNSTSDVDFFRLFFVHIFKHTSKTPARIRMNPTQSVAMAALSKRYKQYWQHSIFSQKKTDLYQFDVRSDFNMAWPIAVQRVKNPGGDHSRDNELTSILASMIESCGALYTLCYIVATDNNYCIDHQCVGSALCHAVFLEYTCAS